MRANIKLSVGSTLIIATLFCVFGVAGQRLSSAQTRAKALGLGTRRAATRMLNGEIPASWIRKAGGVKPPRYLQWPMPEHHLGRGFGSNNGKHLAVDVTAKIGTPVQSMAKGIVGYSNDNVRGYGNMILLVHPGGWVTMYAHLDRFKVQPGQLVKGKQVIALSGNTGLTRGPHLHFALIVNGNPRDPMPYMRGAPERPKRIAMLRLDSFL